MARKRKKNGTTSKKVTQIPSPPRSSVYVKESAESSWSEAIDVTVMSRFGAGFDLSRECRVGSLILLDIALPAEFRAFDQDKELYSVVALVQHCDERVIGNKRVYHISVMFVGKNFPDSYRADPQQAYRLSGSAGHGLWNISECSNHYKSRRYPRFGLKLEVEIGLIQRDKRAVIKEQTVTRDICAAGVSVISTLDAKVGDKVKFACPQIDFYAIAIIVKRRTLFGIQDTLHLKFVDDKFPIKRVLFSKFGKALAA